MKVVITGAAGLIGQNLIARLGQRADIEIVAIDKHPSNTARLREIHPAISVIEADLAEAGDWQRAFERCDILVLGHAQIGGLKQDEFERNNVVATRQVLAAAKKSGCRHVVHLSSSVVNSAVRDFYTESKKAQERLVVESGLPHTILRPTLMFGWFDRKHIGWLARFMKASPVFPIPGNGQFLRQPLYAGDFCNIIIACIGRMPAGEAYNISGLEKIPYIDLIRALRDAAGARTLLMRIPYRLFRLALRVYALFDRNPPFTVKQLEALVTPDIFEVIDWPGIFAVRATPLRDALHETFHHPVYSGVTLDF